MLLKNKRYQHKQGKLLYRRSGIYLISVIVLFLAIGLLTTAQPAYRFSSKTITNWTSDIDPTIFMNLIGMENRAFKQTLLEESVLPSFSKTLFQVATSLTPNDPRSLLRNEIPGFSSFDQNILIAGEGTDFTNYPIESSAPLEEILEERLAVIDEDTSKGEDIDEDTSSTAPTTGKRDVVFIYNTHNRESFLPYLPGTNGSDNAFHKEVNITNVSDRLAKALEAKGIGTQVDKTDIGMVLNEKGMEYWQSYDASGEVVEAAITSNKEIQYIFDLHRDAQGRDVTTKEINGESYARIMFIVGSESKNFNNNTKLATKLDQLIEEKYPGLSRGVIPQGGPGNNGIYNQDLTDNAVLIEFGGVENTLEELYRSADAVAEVFSEYYWDAEAVNAAQ
ncbi:stage II sporulation protein P [Oceanobacillus chungangensis]|uniref:Stage II sporulation protein P n=1 Tax=Oceanobacillus chungangensis TaxID=1229152 RepID=A0A3D8Q2M6_9BACI|nr:stage II sporulation protein P [Oceanobacillus chungangensis]RDW21749.1 stage II sporulation protein P [Oceanobacillus chungangensis]